MQYPTDSPFTKVAWVDALQQNDENRSNLALVNTGEVDDSPSEFNLEIYNGETGLLVNTATGFRVPARHWYQIDGILDKYGMGTTQGYVRISKISGKQSLPGLRSDQRWRGLAWNEATTEPICRLGSRTFR